MSCLHCLLHGPCHLLHGSCHRGQINRSNSNKIYSPFSNPASKRQQEQEGIGYNIPTLVIQVTTLLTH